MRIRRKFKAFLYTYYISKYLQKLIEDVINASDNDVNIDVASRLKCLYGESAIIKKVQDVEISKLKHRKDKIQNMRVSLAEV